MKTLSVLVLLVLLIPLAQSAPVMQAYNYVVHTDVAVPKEVLSDSDWASYVYVFWVSPYYTQKDLLSLVKNYASYTQACDDQLPMAVRLQPTNSEVKELGKQYRMRKSVDVEVSTNSGVKTKSADIFYNKNQETCFNLQRYAQLVLDNQDTADARLNFNEYLSWFETMALQECDYRQFCNVNYQSNDEPTTGLVQYYFIAEHQRTHELLYSDVILSSELFTDYDPQLRFGDYSAHIIPLWHRYSEATGIEDIAPFITSDMQEQTAEPINTTVFTNESEELTTIVNQTLDENTTQALNESMPNIPFRGDLEPQEPVTPEPVRVSLWSRIGLFFRTMFS